MSLGHVKLRTIDHIPVHILESNEQLGQAAAAHFANLII
jgi:hypothetical protein